MSIAGELNTLVTTKAVQRRKLEAAFPYIDWDRMPFSCYVDFFALKNILDDCGAVWTNAYGRSNSEDASTRDILPDYSGNGRDIRLYNFAFTEESGYNTTTYPGALVSDGVDDYGECVKGFALPDDYTVVAIRKMIGAELAALISKGADNGAFLFENYGNTWSYGQATNVSMLEYPLLSYQTKASYNGEAISVGDAVDDASDVLRIFNHNLSGLYKKAALYALGIFTRTLTDEELRVVKNCMMAEWAAMTGELDNITYVADWDGKGRSNNEEEPMRSQWVDKATGKVINLRNFSFSGMSGWNGYAQDFKSDWMMNSSYGRIVNEHTASIDKLSNTIQFYKYVQTGESMDMRIRITGLSRNISEGKATQMRIYSRLQAEPNITVTEDGVYAIHAVYDADDSLYFYIPGTKGEELVTPVTIEQLPLYPGALVSDGVDDYGQTAEAISEEVGTVLVHMSDINSDRDKYYILFGANNLDPNRYALFKYGSTIAFYAPEEIFDIVEGIFAKSKSPVSVNTNLFVCAANSRQAFSRCALYRLIIIKEQLDDAAVEFLKWKVDKEYRDWCIRMGFYEEEILWYGIEFDTTDPSSDVKRIGNMEMHKTLPVQSQMRGCLLNDDGTVAKYLDAADWTSETRDGSAGQVMVEMPKDAYWRFETWGTKRRVKFATTALPGFTRTPQGFVSAYQAAVQRSTGKLCSVVNTDTDYRGGNNEAEYDGTYCSKLGVPATNMTMAEFRTAARDRKPGSHEWDIMTYQFHKLLYWLFVVEYATRNTQKTFNADKDADGFAQGGLGAGVANLSDFSYANRMGCPFIPCGYTDALGNGTGQRAFTLPFEGDATASQSYAGEYSAETAYTAGQLVSQGEDLYLCTAAAGAGTPLTDTEHFSKKTRTVTQVPRYRGVENPFGHVWTAEDGLNVLASPDTEDGGDGLSRAFVCGDPRKFSDTDVTGYDYVGDMSREYNKNISDILFGSGGEIVAKETGGLSSQYFCDRTFAGIPSSRSVMKTSYGGAGNNRDGIAGLVCISTDEVRTSKSTRSGTRLCFIPEEHFED